MNATATAPITPDAEHILRALLADPEPRTYGATTVTSLLAEIDRLRPLLADTAGHLAVIHRHAGRHDVLGTDLACAGCALLDRIEAQQGGA